MIVVVTGPVRSGKSARAAHIARGFGVPIIYVATARVDATDAEMVDRVARHRAERADMTTFELWNAGAPDLPAVVARASVGTTLLIDSVGTWVAGHLLDLERLAERDPLAAADALEERTLPFVESVGAIRANAVIVAEEAGWGLVPPSILGRLFRDALGRLVAKLARRADRFELVVAGYALDLKALGVPVGT